MPTTRYTYMDGELVSEDRDGVNRDYVPDPLGSTVALLDNAQTKTDTFDYWPYGEVASRTGTTPTPFQHVGTQGYYRDNANRTYVQARVLNNQQGRWMTPTPIGFRGGDWNLYRYVRNNPISTSLPDGTSNASGLQFYNRGIKLPVYGNWCGPGWSGPDDPIDDLDRCCRQHDDCYDLNGCNTHPLTPRCRLCDDVLCSCASHANCEWKISCIIARVLITTWMCGVGGLPQKENYTDSIGTPGTCPGNSFTIGFHKPTIRF